MARRRGKRPGDEAGLGDRVEAGSSRYVRLAPPILRWPAPSPQASRPPDPLRNIPLDLGRARPCLPDSSAPRRQNGALTDRFPCTRGTTMDHLVRTAHGQGTPGASGVEQRELSTNQVHEEGRRFLRGGHWIRSPAPYQVTRISIFPLSIAGRSVRPIPGVVVSAFGVFLASSRPFGMPLSTTMDRAIQNGKVALRAIREWALQSITLRI